MSEITISKFLPLGVVGHEPRQQSLASRKEEMLAGARENELIAIRSELRDRQIATAKRIFAASKEIIFY